MLVEIVRLNSPLCLKLLRSLVQQHSQSNLHARVTKSSSHFVNSLNKISLVNVVSHLNFVPFVNVASTSTDSYATCHSWLGQPSPEVLNCVIFHSLIKQVWVYVHVVFLTTLIDFPFLLPLLFTLDLFS